MATIQKLTNSDYLKPLENMNMEEKQSYLQRVRDWLSTRAPILRPKAAERQSQFLGVMAAAQAWNDSEAKAFSEGCVLITALTKCSEGASRWLPDAVYVKSAKRSINAIYHELDKIAAQYGGVNFQREKGSGGRRAYFGPGAADTRNMRGTMSDVMSKQGDAVIEASVKAVSEWGRGKKAPTASQQAVASMWLQRPQHIDQYLHLLPPDTQKRASKVRELHLMLAEAHENLSRLSDNPSAHASDLAYWHNKTVSTEDAIMAIYAELDEQWNVLVHGDTVAVDDFGVARIKQEPESTSPATAEEQPTEEPAAEEQPAEEAPTEEQPAEEVPGQDGVGDEPHADSAAVGPAAPAKKRGRPSKAEQAARKEAAKEAAIAAMSDEDKTKRREYLKKWLRDTRAKKSPKHDEQWLQNLKELQLLGCEVTDSIRRAAEFYELEIIFI